MNNNGIYAININATCGFFATMQIYMYILMHCELRNLLPHVIFTGRNYASSKHHENWFHNYFYYKIVPSEKQLDKINDGTTEVSVIRSANDLPLRDKYNKKITLELAHALYMKYFGINENIIDEVDQFVSEHFKDMPVLGLHYRGTDKRAEAEPVPWESVVCKVKRFLLHKPEVRRIFIATDELDFLDFLRDAKLDVDFICYDNMELYRSTVVPPHWNVQCDRYVMGMEALINCLLLSRCTYCIKTASYLSGWAKIFNLDLPVTMLNKPYRHALWFPDAEIWERQVLRL